MYSYGRIVLILCLFSLCECTTNVNNPTQVYTTLGDTANLDCGYPGDLMKWYKYDEVRWMIIASENHTVNDSKYYTSKNPSGEFYQLHIQNVDTSDFMKYRCLPWPRGLLSTFYFQLVLTEAPSIVSLENVTPENRLLGTEGKTLNISCSAVGGKPAPNVTLIIFGNIVMSSLQTVQYELPFVYRTCDQEIVICEALHPALTNNSLTTTAVIYLNLKPSLPTISPDHITVGETKPIIATCTTEGSRPPARIHWTIGGADLMSNTTKVNHRASDDTYTVTSTLIFNVDRSLNGKNLTCLAVNVASPIEEKTTIYVDVQYAFDLTITNVTYNMTVDRRIVIMRAIGNPEVYTYNKLQHKTPFGIVIRKFDLRQQNELTLSEISETERYQDTGMYVATISNGILDKDGNALRIATGYITVNAQPKVLHETNSIQHAPLGKTSIILVNVYSIPKYITIKWLKTKTFVITQSVKYDMEDESSLVIDIFHGKKVQLPGYRITLSISSVTAEDFTSYTLQLFNGYGHTVEHTVHLQSSQVDSANTEASKYSNAVDLEVMASGTILNTIFVFIFLTTLIGIYLYRKRQSYRKFKLAGVKKICQDVNNVVVSTSTSSSKTKDKNVSKIFSPLEQYETLGSPKNPDMYETL